MLWTIAMTRIPAKKRFVFIAPFLRSENRKQRVFESFSPFNFVVFTSICYYSCLLSSIQLHIN